MKRYVARVTFDMDGHDINNKETTLILDEMQTNVRWYVQLELKDFYQKQDYACMDL